MNDRSLKLLYEQEMVHGLPHSNDSNGVCEGCMVRKQHRDVFPIESNWRVTFPIELVHTNVCGPMQIESKYGNKYFLLFIDDYTRMT